jgi:hypothetical protein
VEAEGSSPRTQQPITGPYPQTDKSTPHPPSPLCEHTVYYKPIYTWIFHSGFSLQFWYKCLSSIIRATCPIHLILLDLIITDNKAPHLYNSLWPPNTSYLLGSSILLGTLFSDIMNLCPSIIYRTKLHNHKKQTGRQNILNWMVASIPQT